MYLYEIIYLKTFPHAKPFKHGTFYHQILSKNFKHIHPYQQVINNLLFSIFLLFSSIFFYFHINFQAILTCSYEPHPPLILTQ